MTSASLALSSANFLTAAVFSYIPDVSNKKLLSHFGRCVKNHCSEMIDSLAIRLKKISLFVSYQHSSLSGSSEFFFQFSPGFLIQSFDSIVRFVELEHTKKCFKKLLN